MYIFHVLIYMSVYYVKRVSMSRSLLFHVFIYMSIISEIILETTSSICGHDFE